MLRLVTSLLLAASAASVPLLRPAAPPRQDLGDVRIEAVELRGGVHALFGAGGNVGLFVGDDGAFLVDDQFAPLSEKLLAAVAERTDAPLRFLVNTHWHFDHTGGNENMAGAGAVIVAHENVRERMSVEQVMDSLGRTVPAAPEGALPVVTFRDSVTFHWNDDEVHVFHVPGAHTDTDAVVHFRGANVVHTGDTFFAGTYPFIDFSSGGSIHGMIGAADAVLALCDAETRIIPGHGSVSGRDDLRDFRDMLVTVRDRIQAHVDDGKSLPEIVAARPTQDLDGRWGGGFMEPDQWVALVHAGMVATDG